MFDAFYISFFNYVKPRFKHKASLISNIYVSLVEILFYGLIVMFFLAFASQMNLIKINTEKCILLSFLTVSIIYFKNWMQYNGKRRIVLNSKSNKRSLQRWKLILLPLSCIILIIIFFQAI